MVTTRMQTVGTRNAAQTFAAWAKRGSPFLFALVAFELAGAQTEIYRCEQADGTTAFQGQPCQDESAQTEPQESPHDDNPEPADDFFEFENPFDAPPDNTPPQTGNRPDSEARAQCEEQARDAIDAIEQEMLQQYSSEQRDEYLTRLRKHTTELRACKEL